LYNLRILAEGSLVAILAIELFCELRAMFDERTGSVYANLAQIALSAQGIGHISHSCKPGGKPTRNKVKYMLNKHILLSLL
jgi:hypothetical protein